MRRETVALVSTQLETDGAVGKGCPVRPGHKVYILYRGRHMNGKKFDANQNRKKPFTFPPWYR
ncbi:hypothetical protein PsorP6_015299 [Peronosclerospora sorghi]|uniref:Uncharacterized protein n=1 Tax=Peronosclerospora sorghi TaxID=230839 RepID=A0ACC0VQT1_9STRA|nr:hypothetical protein PsorP6_015299 [Peronosclerospora sorghi]